MKCFVPTFADAIKERLISKYGHYKDLTRNKYKYDKYESSEVLSVVAALIDEPFVRCPKDEIVIAKKVTVQSQVRDEEVKEKMAQIQDTIVTVDKQMGSI